MQLRVRSLDGAELVLAMPPLTVRVQVAEIKRRALMELQRLREMTEFTTATVSSADASDVEAVEERRMTRAWLAFRGQLLADVDDINLFALTPLDFFVLIEEEDLQEEDGRDEDTGDEETKHGDRHEKPPPVFKRRRQAAKESGVNRGLAEAVVMQLVEMGFAVNQAREATELARAELPRAIALLTGEVDASTVFDRGGNTSASQSNRLRAYINRLIRRYPELAAIESLLQNEQVHALKRVAMTSDFEALVTLKEAFPAHWLAQMNENPSATALFLAIPDQFERASVKPRETTTSPVKKDKAVNNEVDLTDDTVSTGGENVVSLVSHDQDAIDRLTAMGFASDLVAAIYESCGGNEELAANLLFETLP